MPIHRDVAAASQEDLSSLAATYIHGRVVRRDLDPMTARNYRTALRAFTASVSNLPFNVSDIEHWQAERSHLRRATVRREFSMVRTFSRWLVREGYLEISPFETLAPPRLSRSVPRALPVDAIEHLLVVVPDARARAIIWLMVGLGLRCIEVERLELGDWDRSLDLLLVRGKFSHERMLPVTTEVAAALDSYLRDHPASSGPFIRSYRRPGHPLRADTISGMVSEWMTAAEIKSLPHDGVSAHALRHTAASDVLDQCGDLRVVQEMLGHRNLSTTSIYLRRAGAAKLREAMAGRKYRRRSPAA